MSGASSGASTIALAAVASQSVNIILGSQSCTLNIYQRAIGVTRADGSVATAVPLLMDIYVGGVLILGGALCRNGVKIVRDVYLGFVGDLVFYDTQGTADPVYTGFGSRFILTYWPALA